MSREKILVAVPGYHGIQPEAQESYIQMMFRAGRDLPDYDVAIEVMIKAEQFRARNRIVNAAIANKFDYLLMLDDDHIVPHNLLTRLMGHIKEHPEYAVIGALYFQRGGSYEPVIMRRKSLEKEDWRFNFIRHDDEILANPGLHEVDIVGGGCMMFRMSVLEKLLPPFFVPEIEVGTDIAICSRIRDLGYKIAVDTSIELGHLGEKTIVTSRSIGGLGQKMALINKTLHEDVKEYLGLSQQQLEQEMALAMGEMAREEKWRESVGDSQEWEDIKKYYQDHGSWHILNLLYFNMQQDSVKELAVRLMDGKINPGDRVLDYGPGLGHLTIPFLQHGCKVDTVEVANAPTRQFVAWRYAKHDIKSEYFEFWLNESYLPHEMRDDRKYKAAFLISAIDHLTHPYETMEWITAHMEIGGYLICDYMHAHSAAHNPQHLDRIDTSTFERWMRDQGWETSPESVHMLIYRGV